MSANSTLDILQTLSVTLEQKDSHVSRLSFLRLPHPRTGIPCLFLPSLSGALNKSKILEVQAVSPPDARSWFLGEEVVSGEQQNGSAGTYRQADDIFEEAATKLQERSNDAPLLEKDIIGLGSIQCAKDALRNVCDVKEISPEIVVYRLSQPKVLDYLRSKVTRLSAPDALEVSKSTIRALAKDGLMEDGKEALLQVGRVRAACDLLSQYLSPECRALLLQSYDFSELDAFLQAALDEAAAAVVVDTKGGKKVKIKPSTVDDKKRKNAKGSQGVEKLKKANVNGMAKLSSFFGKKT
ncbi:hypothetical protein DXG01_005062 [Tephrocybe rancida]|nr:hypothetical protein DXG01_005062 [Tephrocybe rancida]